MVIARFKSLLVICLFTFSLTCYAQWYESDTFKLRIGKRSSSLIYEVTRSNNSVDSLVESYRYNDSSYVRAKYLFDFKNFAYFPNRNDSIITFIEYSWDDLDGKEFLRRMFKYFGYTSSDKILYIHSSGKDGFHVSHRKDDDFLHLDYIPGSQNPKLTIGEPFDFQLPLSLTWFTKFFIENGVLISSSISAPLEYKDGLIFTKESFFCYIDSNEFAISLLKSMGFKVNHKTKKINGHDTREISKVYTITYDDYSVNATTEKYFDKVTSKGYTIINFELVFIHGN